MENAWMLRGGSQRCARKLLGSHKTNSKHSKQYNSNFSTILLRDVPRLALFSWMMCTYAGLFERPT